MNNIALKSFIADFIKFSLITPIFILVLNFLYPPLLFGVVGLLLLLGVLTIMSFVVPEDFMLRHLNDSLSKRTDEQAYVAVSKILSGWSTVFTIIEVALFSLFLIILINHQIIENSHGTWLFYSFTFYAVCSAIAKQRWKQMVSKYRDKVQNSKNQ